MSQDSLRAALSDDAPANRSGSDDYVSARHPSRRPPLRARPQSWHPYGPVEPPLDASARSIGVHSILNPPAQAVDVAGGREPLNFPGPASPRPRPRQGSSPAPRALHGMQPLSPRSHSRGLMNPSSPSARFVSGSGRKSGQSSVSHSPLVAQEPPPLSTRQHPPPSSPLPLDAVLRPLSSLPTTQPATSTSLHSTASIHSRRASAGPGAATDPNSQETSPITPHSSYGHFVVSPAQANASMPPSIPPYSASTPYMTIEAINRSTTATAGPRVKEEPISQSNNLSSGLIPCVLDLKSGSSSQAEKRKANSDASRRFRNRKRNEMQLEQRLAAQQDEITRHIENVRRQSEEIRSLVQQRDHYRSERDFFRDHLGRSMSLSTLPPRPASPALPPDTGVSWSGDASRPPAQSGRILEGRPQASWPGSPAASYSPTSSARSLAPSGPPPVSGTPLPPFQGSWSRQ
ncbi:hypothetical protein N7532_009291 [Penicillium argentinense]|uniref:BZIP domain-containing protein n=1 Tax=Penicillium argentinense TaxID=1131581 RepID=A0A9W9EZ36_9EURO|nr:uncharacterized protein N7532_009291 [Penicillium argentinense]KAJ5090607.1 hypothetical protein N7532_009291 [Penicillium argentinense]